jgi:hypothetical protein
VECCEYRSGTRNPRMRNAMFNIGVMLRIYDFVDLGVAFDLRRVNSISAMSGAIVLMMMPII